MRRITSITFLLCSLASGSLFAQYDFNGYVDKGIWSGDVYLSVVEDFRKISGIYPEQILQKVTPDSSGFFSLSGDNLPLDNRIYRIHVDNCLEEDQGSNHFSGHCPHSKEVVFIANNTDSLSLPYSFDNEMFCRIISKSEKPNALVKIDSLKEEMRYAFGSYRSEANRKLNSKKWFEMLQEFGTQLKEPLAELYIYSFLSDRSSNLHKYYLEDLQSNTYYDGLKSRLNKSYPGSIYAKGYAAELASDRFLLDAGAKKKLPWWLYLLSGVMLLSILGNLYFFGRLKKLTQRLPDVASQLSKQEKKVLDLILADKSNKEIASEMFVSVSTVKTHINKLYKKLNISSRDQAKELFSK